MAKMTDEQRRTFLSEGTRTGILSTTRKDGTPHAAPVWFLLDGDTIVFMTGATTVKGRNLARTGVAVLTVDESTPPFDFVTVTGDVEISDDLDAMLPWSIKIAGRYMGADLADQYGRRNAAEGEILCRLTPRHVVALTAIAD